MSKTSAATDEATLAREAGRQLADLADRDDPVTLVIRGEGKPRIVELPAAAMRRLLAVLEDMATGASDSPAEHPKELTTQQAADLLNVSRPFLIGLLDNRRIPCRKVGSHRRVRLDDVLRYKASIDAERRKVLDELAAEAQALDLGY